MNCPTCGTLIPPELILHARQSDLAKRPRKYAPRPGAPRDNRSTIRNPWGSKGKPKETK